MYQAPPQRQLPPLLPKQRRRCNPHAHSAGSGASFRKGGGTLGGAGTKNVPACSGYSSRIFFLFLSVCRIYRQSLFASTRSECSPKRSESACILSHRGPVYISERSVSTHAPFLSHRWKIRVQALSRFHHGYQRLVAIPMTAQRPGDKIAKKKKKRKSRNGCTTLNLSFPL